MRKRKAELRVRIDEDIYDILKQIAQREGRTVSELVREAVADLLKERKTENETLEIAQ
jgi:predicted transcriptional regulator